jgi:hypothetical protein
MAERVCGRVTVGENRKRLSDQREGYWPESKEIFPGGWTI